MTKIAIVILNFNGNEDTLACLKSIETSEVRNFSYTIVLVDNGSSDSLNKADLERFSQVKLIVNKQNLGFAEGNNKGINWGLARDFDYFFILNNDTILAKDTIKNLIKGATENEEWAVVTPKIYFAKGFEFHRHRYQEAEKGRVIWYAGGIIDWSNVLGTHVGVDEVDKGQFNQIRETEYASGCAMMVKREVFDKIGLFDKRYFLYYEDLDFSLRCQKAGYKIIFYPQAILWHKNAASAYGSGSSLQDYFISRNRLLFGMMYAPLKSKLLLVKESISLLVKGRKWQRLGVKDFYLGKFGKGSYSLVS